MTVADDVPAVPDDRFPRPPGHFVDREGREIAVRSLDDATGTERERAVEGLVDMYERFDPADRAQGIPPAGRERVETWVDSLASADAVNVLAWDGESVAGHAALVTDREGGYELAIFVHQDYQRAGIGSRLIRHLLGAGADRGVERVWLTVERGNEPAIALYEDVGFEPTGDERFELTMALRID